MGSPIYLDYNATTPQDPLVVQAMLPFITEQFGNPSSSHRLGKQAHRAMDLAREQLARLIGASASEIVFTGGGTEASNQVIKGVFFENPAAPCHLIISAIEHPATYAPCQFLSRFGVETTVIPVDSHGCVDPDAVRKAIRPTTKLISIMHSNNEVGTIQPIEAIARIAHDHGVRMHTDVAQSLGKVPISVAELDVDFLTIAGHKLYVPKGIGALYIRKGVTIPRFIDGAGHESGRRAGTENIPYIVGLGRGAEIAENGFPESTQRLKSLRDRLQQGLQSQSNVVVNGHPELRLPNTLNLSFPGYFGSEVLEMIPEIAASTGSACHEGIITESPVLKAMGLATDVVRGAVRLTVGRFSTEEEIDQAIELFQKRIGK